MEGTWMNFTAVDDNVMSFCNDFKERSVDCDTNTLRYPSLLRNLQPSSREQIRKNAP